jgi:hypothetical protein
MCTPLHTKFNALEHLAEGQILCATENVVERGGVSNVTEWDTESSVIQKKVVKLE